MSWLTPSQILNPENYTVAGEVVFLVSSYDVCNIFCNFVAQLSNIAGNRLRLSSWNFHKKLSCR